MTAGQTAEATRWRGRLDRWVGRALLDEEDPTALGLTRVLVVSVLLLSLLTHVGSVANYFSSDAVLFGDWARSAFPTRWSLFFAVEDPTAVRAVFAVGVIAHVAWLVGLYTSAAGVVSFVVWVSMVGRNPLLYSLPDQLQMALAFLLMLMPAGRGVSLDAAWRGKSRPVPVWCRRLIQLQLAVVYTGTGMLKTGPTWRSEGTALYYALVNPYNRHFQLAPVLAVLQPWILRPLTWAVLAWEVGFAGFVAVHWIREMLGRPRRMPDVRVPYLAFGVAMHVGIQSMLYVAWFTPLMVAAYACFLAPQEAKAMLGRLRAMACRFVPNW